MPPHDYVSYFANAPNPGSLLLLLLLALMRLIPIVVLSPFYGAKLLPGPIKVGIALSLSAIFMPQIAYLTKVPLTFDFAFLGLAFKEILIGSIMGFMVSIPFSVASSSGTLVDQQRGSSSFMMQDPALQIQASPIGLLYNNVLIYIFFAMGGAGFFLQAVASSYNMIPPDKLINPDFFRYANSNFWTAMIGILAHLMRLAAQLAAPPIVAMFMSDLFLGIANRLATQVPMSFLMWSLKAFIGVAVLWAAWGFIANQLVIETASWLKFIDRLVTFFPVATG